MSTLDGPTLLYLAKIRLDGGTQPREKLDQATVDEYAEAMENQAQFPPITVFYDGIDYWCVDGFHRIAAALQRGQTRLIAIIKNGSLADAQWYSFGVNKTHGLRRTNEDKRKAVEGALEHDRGSRRTDSVIAEHCGVTHELVRTTRASLESVGRICQLNERVGKDGKTYDVSKRQEANKKRAEKNPKKTTTTTTTVTVDVEEEPEMVTVEEHEDTPVEIQEMTVLEPTTDGLGRPVPAALDPAFRIVGEGFEAVRNKIIGARTAWGELMAKLEAHPWIGRNRDFCQVQDEIEKLKLLVRDLTDHAPFAPCVYCGALAPGDSQDVCPGCRGSSWLSKGGYRSAPELLREPIAA